MLLLYLIPSINLFLDQQRPLRFLNLLVINLQVKDHVYPTRLKNSTTAFQISSTLVTLSHHNVLRSPFALVFMVVAVAALSITSLFRRVASPTTNSPHFGAALDSTL